ncbi:MAG: hypothetical protein EBZ60_00380 [Betaproteobacteria bacterium]|nr:hypothetical protein [Betaproteobacteria bacterium]
MKRIIPKIRQIAEGNFLVYFLIFWSMAFTVFALILSFRFSAQVDNNTLIKNALYLQHILHQDVLDQEFQLSSLAASIDSSDSTHFNALAAQAMQQAPNIQLLELRDESGKRVNSLSAKSNELATIVSGRREVPPSVVINFFKAVDQQKPFWGLSYADDGRVVFELIAPSSKKHHVLVALIDANSWINTNAKQFLPKSIQVSILDKSTQDMHLEDAINLHLGLTGVDVQLLFRNLVSRPSGIDLSSIFILLLGIALIALLVRFNFEVMRSKKTREQLIAQELALAKQAQLSTLGEISTTLAHELNQPLATIGNYIAMCEIRLRQLGFKDPTLEQALHDARAQALRAGEVVLSIRNFLRKGHSAKATVNIDQAVSHLMPILNALVKENKAIIQVISEPDLQIRIDPALFEQILLNLCKNGLDAMVDTPIEQRKLTVTSHRKANPNGKHTVLISVKDAGHGIKEQDGEQLFDSFFTTKIEGLGIGLNLVKSLTESHNGQISWINNPDRGVTFTLAFPEHISSS